MADSKRRTSIWMVRKTVSTCLGKKNDQSEKPSVIQNTENRLCVKITTAQNFLLHVFNTLPHVKLHSRTLLCLPWRELS